MKRLLLPLALAATATFADAQGTIQFPRLRIEYCLAGGMGAPDPGALSFGLFAGPSAGSLSSQPVLPLGTNTAAGFIGAPGQFAYQLPGFEPGSTVFVQVRGWETRFGLDWERSRREGMFGQTEIISVLLGPASGPGTVVAGPNAEIVMCIPEPSTIALALFGLGGLWLFRRRKKS
jgi:hypothetical protein